MTVNTTCKSPSQEQPHRGVPMKRCSENMQQVYRRTPMPKCDLNKVALLSNLIEIALRHGCSPVNLLHIFSTPFSFGGKGWFLLPYLLCCTFKSTGFHKHFHTPTLRLLLSPKIFYKSKENYIFTRRKDCSFWDQILETADVLQTMLKIFIVSTIIHFFYKIFSIGVMLYFGRHFLTIPYLLFFLKRSI